MLAARPALMPLSALWLLWSLLWVGAVSADDPAERPNIVWILSEDNSHHYLRLYDPHGAETPRIAQLAEEGLLFERAFSNSPVCSVARTTLMTSVYAPRAGTHLHRKLIPVTFPQEWQMFPYHLRQAGYHTTNNFKTDYNVRVEMREVWNASNRRATWRDRETPETPFFHMHTFTHSHESSLHFNRDTMRDTRTAASPERMVLPPYHPDTEIFRYTHARYHDRIGGMDALVGGLVDELEADGLLERTFIFYFGDHGGVLPRSKGYVYEAGLQVPLVVRVPRDFAHLVDTPEGTAPRGLRAAGFVEFVDFGPTVLQLAGVDVPDHVDGRPFLGPGVRWDEVAARDETLGYADRFDAKYDMVRSLRRGRFKYIRSYQPYYPDALHNNYRYQMLAYAEWRRMFRDGELDPAQRAFFEPKPAEMLFDLESDPHETVNLADKPAHAETLRRMRTRLSERLKSLPDWGFYPEAVLVERAIDDPVGYADARREEIARLIDTADLVLLPWPEARPRLAEALRDENPWVRYRAATVAASFGRSAREMTEAADLLEDENLSVRIRAAEWAGISGGGDPVKTLQGVLRESESPATTLLALNAVVFLRDEHDFEFPLSADDIPARNQEIERRLLYLGW